MYILLHLRLFFLICEKKITCFPSVFLSIVREPQEVSCNHYNLLAFKDLKKGKIKNFKTSSSASVQGWSGRGENVIHLDSKVLFFQWTEGILLSEKGSLYFYPIICHWKILFESLEHLCKYSHHNRNQKQANKGTEQNRDEEMTVNKIEC